MTEHKQVTFANGWPKVLRYSSVIARLRSAAHGEHAKAAQHTIDTLTVMYTSCGDTCSVHGKLEDPILFTVDYDGGSKVAFACPHCSDPELLARWEREPPGWLGDFGPTA